MTIGVLWEFIEFSADRLFLLDMQKDTIVNAISSVSLDPTDSNISITVNGIKDVILVTGDGEMPLGLGGFLDIGEKRPLTTALTLRRKRKSAEGGAAK